MFGEARGPGVGAPLEQGVVDHQARVDDPGVGQKGCFVLTLDVDGHMVALDADQLAFEALAALSQSIDLDARLAALEGGEVLQPRQRPVDAGAGDLQQVLALDRVRRVQHQGEGARQAGAVLHVHGPVGPLGHDLQPPCVVAAHQSQAHHREPGRLGDGVDELQQPLILGGLAAQTCEPLFSVERRAKKKRLALLRGRRS